jgi:hypothetical protein
MPDNHDKKQKQPLESKSSPREQTDSSSVNNGPISSSSIRPPRPPRLSRAEGVLDLLNLEINPDDRDTIKFLDHGESSGTNYPLLPSEKMNYLKKAHKILSIITAT